MELVIKFPDKSQSFTNGVEFGRILQQMEEQKMIVSNSAFPLHKENERVVRDAAKVYGYRVTFIGEHYGEWINFFAIRESVFGNKLS